MEWITNPATESNLEENICEKSCFTYYDMHHERLPQFKAVK